MGEMAELLFASNHAAIATVMEELLGKEDPLLVQKLKDFTKVRKEKIARRWTRQ